MSQYIEPYIIMVLGLLIFDFKLSEISDILMLLCALILVSLLVIVRFDRFRLLLIALSTVLVCFFPSALCFFPVLIYFGIYSKNTMSTLGLFLLTTIIATAGSPQLIIVNTLLCGFSGYMAYAATKKHELLLKTRELRDNSVEREMLLNQKNKQLLEAQHDQVHLATLTERNRIAREIHDNVGHQLSRAIIQVGAISAVTKDDQIKPLLTSLKGTLDEAMTNIRTSVHDLHDESIDLSNSLSNICKDFAFCPVNLQCEVGANVPKDIKYCFITIVKEALNNISKHSNADKCSVYVHEHPGFYQLLIEDNGTKINNTTSHSGIGLINMQDRVEALGGHITITNTQGFRIFISIPKNLH